MQQTTYTKDSKNAFNGFQHQKQERRFKVGVNEKTIDVIILIMDSALTVLKNGKKIYTIVKKKVKSKV